MLLAECLTRSTFKLFRGCFWVLRNKTGTVAGSGAGPGHRPRADAFTVSAAVRDRPAGHDHGVLLHHRPRLYGPPGRPLRLLGGVRVDDDGAGRAERGARAVSADCANRRAQLRPAVRKRFRRNAFLAPFINTVMETTPNIYRDRLGTSTLRKGTALKKEDRSLFVINAGSWRRTGRQEVARRELEGTWKGGGGGVMIMLLMGRLALLLESRGCRECSG
jgi:hypothetical protein